MKKDEQRHLQDGDRVEVGKRGGKSSESQDPHCCLRIQSVKKQAAEEPKNVEPEPIDKAERSSG